MQKPPGSYAPAISPFAAQTGTKPLPGVSDPAPEHQACCVSETNAQRPAEEMGTSLAEGSSPPPRPFFLHPS